MSRLSQKHRYLEAHRSELLAAKAQQEAVETAARRQRAAEWRETYARRAAETRTARLSEPRRGEDVVGVAYGGGAAGGTSSRAGDGEASTWSRVLTLVDAPERARTSQHGHTHQHESRARHHYATLAKLAGAGGAGAPAS